MGCRQSKQSDGQHFLPISSSAWLTSLGLQQYSAAFFAAGYGDIDTLSGLSRKQVNEIALFQKGGIPSAHVKLLLDASKQLSSRQPAQSQQPFSAPPSSLLEAQPAAVNQTQVHLHAATDHSTPSQPNLRSTSVGRLHQARLANTASSFASATSYDSGYDTDDASTHGSFDSTIKLLTPVDKHTSIGPSLNATATGQPSHQTFPGSAAKEDGPSQQHLQQLYNAMQDDYKRLQQLHPASGRLHNSKHPVAAAKRQADKDALSNAAQPPSAAGAQHEVAHVHPEQDHYSMQAGQKVFQQRHSHEFSQQVAGVHQPPHSIAASDGTAVRTARPTAHQAATQHHLVEGPPVKAVPKAGSGKASSGSTAADMVKHMRKRKTAMQEEPFVHVYTNFHTLSKDVPTQAEGSVNESDLLQIDQACTDSQPLEVQLQNANHINLSTARGRLQAVQQEPAAMQQVPTTGQQHGSCADQHLHPGLNAETCLVQQQQQQQQGDAAIGAQQLQQQQPFDAATSAQQPQHVHMGPVQQLMQVQQQKPSLWPLSEQQTALLLPTPQQQQAAHQQEGSEAEIAAVHGQNATAWHMPLQGVDIQNQRAVPQYVASHPDDEPATEGTPGWGTTPLAFESPGHKVSPQYLLNGAPNASQHAKQRMQHVIQHCSLSSESDATKQQLALPVAQPMVQQPNPYPPPGNPDTQHAASSVTQQAWSSASSMTYQPQAGAAQHHSETHQAASLSKQYQHQPAAVMQQSVHSQNSWQSRQAPLFDGSSRDQMSEAPASGYAVSGRQQQLFVQQRVQRDAQGKSTSVTYSQSSSSHEFSFRTSRPQSDMPSSDGGNVAPQAESTAASAAAVEALRVIKMAKLHRHGPPSRLMPGQHHMVQQQMQQMDAQIRQRVQFLQQRAL